jgi:SRSO17 transposase
VVLEGRRRAQAAWLTNLADARLPDLITLMRSARMVEQELDRMGDGCGLRHFEGRSFRGWHHHVTLASVAHGHQLLDALRAQQAGHRPFVAV